MAQKQELIDRLWQTKYADVGDAHGFPIRPGTPDSPTSAPCTSTASRWWHPLTWWLPASRRTSRTCRASTRSTLTSTTAMEQQQLPASLVVLGAGYVGWNRPSCSRTSACRSPS